MSRGAKIDAQCIEVDAYLVGTISGAGAPVGEGGS